MNKVIVIVIVSFLFSWSILPTTIYAEEQSNLAEIEREVHTLTERYDLDYSLIMGQIQLESEFNNESVSSVGAFGIMQLMEGTARWMYDIMVATGELSTDVEYSPTQWKQNLHLGIYHMKWLLDTYCDGGRDKASYTKAFGYYWMGIGGYPRYVESNGIDTSYSEIVFNYAGNYEEPEEVISGATYVGSLKEFENEISIEAPETQDKTEVDIHGTQDDQRGIRSTDEEGLGEIQGREEESGEYSFKEEDRVRRKVIRDAEKMAPEESKETSEALAHTIYGLLLLEGIFMLIYAKECIIHRIKRTGVAKK